VTASPAKEQPVTSPADELRTAAQTLRSLTAAVHAPDLPDQSWHTEPCASEERGDCPCIVAQGTCNTEGSFVQPLFYVADAETPELAAYIAAMGPNVGTVLADWLNSAAEDAEQIGPDPHALAVARAITTHPTT
jgi:hypothetical protein